MGNNFYIKCQRCKKHKYYQKEINFTTKLCEECREEIGNTGDIVVVIMLVIFLIIILIT